MLVPVFSPRHKLPPLRAARKAPKISLINRYGLEVAFPMHRQVVAGRIVMLAASGCLFSAAQIPASSHGPEGSEIGS